MFQLVRDMARARTMVDLNIAAGVARPKLAKAAIVGLSSAVAILCVAVALLWLSYADVADHLSRQDRVLQQQNQVMALLDARENAGANQRLKIRAQIDEMYSVIVGKALVSRSR